MDLNKDEKMLYDMLVKKFTTEHQQIFLKHFQLFLAYDRRNDFVIDLDDIWEWAGFSKKFNAKRHLTALFRNGTDYIIQHRTCNERTHGGNNKEHIMLNIECFKAFCMLAHTKKGQQTRDYYLTMEEVYFEYTRKVATKHIQDLQKEIQTSRAIERHNNLKEANKDKPCVYLIKVSEVDDETFTVKIGETDDIQQRINSLRCEYKNCLLLDVYPCYKAHKFEQYLLNRPDIKKHRILGTELVEISKDFCYKQLQRIIDSHINYYNDMTPKEKLELAKYKATEEVCKVSFSLIEQLAKTNDHDERNYLKQQISLISQSFASHNANLTIEQEDFEIMEHEIKSDRQVFKYNPTDLVHPICSFYSLREAARSLGDPKIHDYHIRNAANENIIFGGFRWFYIDEGAEPPNAIPNTKEDTRIQKQIRKGAVAQISKEKDRILNVFSNQVEAASTLKVASCSIAVALSKASMSGGYYWKMYEDCDDNLRATFKGDIPQQKTTKTSSKKVHRIDPYTNEVVEVYDCIQDVCSKFHTCHKTINKASDNGNIYKGFKWLLVQSD